MQANYSLWPSTSRLPPCFCVPVPCVCFRSKIPGGVVGKQWRLLTVLVTLFTVGYFITPFFTLLPPEIINLIVALIFFFGAIYVLITVRLIYRIIEELTN
ncbi:hypothetical protein [Candidatus Aalborgicola defluviihabitans]|uniref:hypothetical protein n=1 Tax=Candidatus Aalborgicola defluviihabitans TaxID=3386187 RepID=UPI001DF6DE71|nr:hypothetical protein [Burkholderiales bacterium]